MRPETETRLSAWVPAVAWTALIFCVSSIPGLAPVVLKFKFGDKLAHASEYTGLGIFLTIAYRGSLSSRRMRFATLLAIATGLGIGVSDELYQLSVPGRAVEFLDWVADASGVVIGNRVMAYYYARFRPWAAAVAKKIEASL